MMLNIQVGLIELYDSTMSFIKNNTKKGWRKDNDKRVELSDYPERVLEEGYTYGIYSTRHEKNKNEQVQEPMYSNLAICI